MICLLIFEQKYTYKHVCMHVLLLVLLLINISEISELNEHNTKGEENSSNEAISFGGMPSIFIESTQALQVVKLILPMAVPDRGSTSFSTNDISKYKENSV